MQLISWKGPRSRCFSRKRSGRSSPFNAARKKWRSTNATLYSFYKLTTATIPNLPPHILTEIVIATAIVGTGIPRGGILRENARTSRRRGTALGVEKLAERGRDIELAAIKEEYLGSKKPKKRVIKPSEKFRFSFDWENTEDTSRDMNSLYQNPHEARLLFGRGFRAGMNRREQKKLAAKNEKELRDEIRKKALRRLGRKLLRRRTRSRLQICMIHLI